jgi:hypothetical protein
MTPSLAKRAFVLALLLHASSVCAATIRLSEVLYDAAGSDDGGVFVELHGPAGLDLTGFVIEGVNGSNGDVTPSLALSGVIPADGLFVLADRRADGSTDVAEADLLLNFDFQNGPDSVRVLASDMSVLDALGYGSFGPGDVFAGEGSAAPDGAPGQSLARVFANVDTDQNAADFALLDVPTPGQALLAAPEPSTAVLLSTALVLLLVRRIRR